MPDGSGGEIVFPKGRGDVDVGDGFDEGGLLDIEKEAAAGFLASFLPKLPCQVAASGRREGAKNKNEDGGDVAKCVERRYGRILRRLRLRLRLGWRLGWYVFLSCLW
jgi:hypothetical protein